MIAGPLSSQAPGLPRGGAGSRARRGWLVCGLIARVGGGKRQDLTLTPCRRSRQAARWRSRPVSRRSLPWRALGHLPRVPRPWPGRRTRRSPIARKAARPPRRRPRFARSCASRPHPRRCRRQSGAGWASLGAGRTGVGRCGSHGGAAIFSRECAAGVVWFRFEELVGLWVVQPANPDACGRSHCGALEAGAASSSEIASRARW